MFVFRFIFRTFTTLIAALAGNWAGDRLRDQVTGRNGHQLRLVHTNEQGESIVALNPLLSNVMPALIMGSAGRPRWLYTFVGGILASAFLGDRYEEQFMEYLQGERSITLGGGNELA
ncbi:MAG: hypothetical protein P8X95_03870 [Anaerolineales bacterium]|jgi:hypothetical protein